MSMVKLYTAAANFVAREKSLLGDTDILPTQEAQLGHFVDSVRSFERDVEDASAMYTILDADSPTHAFTSGQRKRIAQAISVHMRGVAAATVSSGDAKNQSHLSQYNYWSNQMWDDAWNKEYSKSQTFSAVIDWYLTIGLRFPSDDTVKQTLAMIGVGRDEKNTPQQNYDDIHEFKRALRVKRELYPGATTFKNFPDTPGEFKLLHADRLPYEPVASRIDYKLLRELVHRDVMPSRSNNRNMNGETARAASSHAHHSASRGVAMPPMESDTRLATRTPPQRAGTTSHLLQGMQRQSAENREMQERMFQFIMHGGAMPNAGAGQRRDPVITIFGERAHGVQPAPDQSSNSAHHQPLADSVHAGGPSSAPANPPKMPDAAPSSLKNMIDNLHLLRSDAKKKPKSKAKKGAAKKDIDVDSESVNDDDPAPADDDDEGEDGDEDEDEDEAERR